MVTGTDRGSLEHWPGQELTREENACEDEPESYQAVMMIPSLGMPTSPSTSLGMGPVPACLLPKRGESNASQLQTTKFPKRTDWEHDRETRQVVSPGDDV